MRNVFPTSRMHESSGSPTQPWSSNVTAPSSSAASCCTRGGAAANACCTVATASGVIVDPKVHVFARKASGGGEVWKANALPPTVSRYVVS